MLGGVLEIELASIVKKVCAMLCHLMFSDSRKDVKQIVTVAEKISTAPSRVSVSRSGETADTGGKRHLAEVPAQSPQY